MTTPAQAAVFNPDEEWRAINGSPGYEVSNLGRVRSLTRRINNQVRVGHILKPWAHSPGTDRPISSYHVLVGTRKCGVHRLVLEAFVGQCPSNMEGCHNDGDVSNNRLKNLRWDTRKGNHADKLLHGTHFRGPRSPNAKLTDDDVRCIRAEPSGRGTGAMLARAFGVCHQLIGEIRNDMTRWPHITTNVVHAR